LENRQLLTIIPPGPSTLQGLDVSQYDGTVDWNAVAASGRNFAFVRVSNGTTADSAFAQNYSGVKTAGLVRGAYQLFRPGQDPSAQASLLLQEIGTLGPGDLPPVLDVELTDGQTPAAISAGIQTWVTAVQNATGRPPIIYTSAFFWNAAVGSSSFAGNPLWIANWGVSAPNVPSPWHSWVFWQYSVTGFVSGVSSQVDLDEFNGTLADLNHLAGVASQTTLTSSANPSVLGQGVTFTATVSATTSGLGTPTGSAHFVDVTTGTDLGTVALSPTGSASVTVSNLAVGSHTIEAVYAGQGSFLGSNTTLTQQVDYHFMGFLPPLRQDGTYHLGRTLPIKFQLTDFSGSSISSLNAVTSLQVQQVDPQGNPLGAAFQPEGAGHTSLRYDPTANEFVFNWDTKGLAAGYYDILLTLADGTTHTLTIQLE
jgi:lysozyme